MEVLDKVAEPIFSPLLHRYTLPEFWALPEADNHSHYELIGGYLFMVPPPSAPHGRIDARLAASLHKHLEANNIRGEVHHPREPIINDAPEGTYLEPDMMYVSEELRERMGAERSSADIVFEYLSESTALYDRTTKADTYLALGVHELWLIDPETFTVEVRIAISRKDRPAWQIHQYNRGDRANSKVLPGWLVSVDELFEGLT